MKFMMGWGWNCKKDMSFVCVCVCFWSKLLQRFFDSDNLFFMMAVSHSFYILLLRHVIFQILQLTPCERTLHLPRIVLLCLIRERGNETRMGMRYCFIIAPNIVRTPNNQCIVLQVVSV